MLAIHGLMKPAMKKVIRSFDRACRDSHPTRAIADWFVGYMKFVNEADPRLFRRGFRELFEALNEPATTNWAETNARRRRAALRRKVEVAGPRGQLICDLLDAVHARIPYAPIWIRQESLIHENVKDLRARRMLARAKSAEAIAMAARECLEHVYEPFLRHIWSLFELSMGRSAKTPGNIGSLNDLAVRAMQGTRFAQLLNPRAIRRRNAFTHGHWRVDRADQFVLWDARGSPAAAEQIDVIELHMQTMEDCYLSSVVMESAQSLFRARHMQPPSRHGVLLMQFLPRLFSDEATEREEAATAIVEDIQRLNAPLAEFVRANSSSSAAGAENRDPDIDAAMADGEISGAEWFRGLGS